MSGNDLTALRALPGQAADYITVHGWAQGEEQDDHGQVCLTGALRMCAPAPGDFGIARAVFRHHGRAETWNDKDDRTEAEVVKYLAAAEITDADLADTFGPQWQEVITLVRTLAAATPEQIKAMNAVWAAAREAACDAAWDAAWEAAREAADASRDASWGASWGAAWEAAWGAARDAAREAAWDVVREAARALVVRDLIGQHGFTQEAYDLLTSPWVTVFGPLHPEDVTA